MLDGKKLKEVMTLNKITIPELSLMLKDKSIKLGVESIKKYRAGAVNVPSETISAFSEIFNRPEQYFFVNGDDSIESITKKELKENISKYSSFLPSNPNINKIDVAYFENSFACAGNGLINYDEVPKPMTFDRGFLEQQLGTKNFKNLHVIKVKGNSMEPTIKSGEFIMINPFENDGFSVKNGSIYLVNYYDDIMIKRVTRNNKTKEILLNSENKEEHPQIKIKQEDEDYFKIVGAVVAHFSFM